MNGSPVSSSPGSTSGRSGALDRDGVEGRVGDGGAALGARREVPAVSQLYAPGRSIDSHRIDGLLVIGGDSAYQAAHLLMGERDRHPALSLPIVCVPVSIDNSLPCSEPSIGADTALNSAVLALDAVKQSAAALRRCFVAETTGRKCGYLMLMSGIATDAEQAPSSIPDQE